jgi:enolase
MTVGGVDARVLPVPMLNVLNGGVHADSNVSDEALEKVSSHCLPDGTPAHSFRSLLDVLR